MNSSRADRFLALHHSGSPLLMPNPWDVGSARALATLGFAALATTSSGLAASLGRLDGSVNRDEALAHAGEIASATDLPVSADLENCFGDEPEAVALVVAAAATLGLAGCSIEDYTRNDRAPIYDRALAADRVAAAKASAGQLVLTARAENFLHGRTELADTIGRLQSYQEAGADVLYAPGLTRAEDIKAVIGAVDLPVNVLLLPKGPTVSELGALGVSRISIGGTFAFAGLGSLVRAARELLGAGPYSFFDLAASGRDLARQAFGGQ